MNKKKKKVIINLALYIFIFSFATTSLASDNQYQKQTEMQINILSGDLSHPPEPVPPRPFIEKVEQSSANLPETGAIYLNWRDTSIGWVLVALGLGRYMYCYQECKKKR